MLFKKELRDLVRSGEVTQSVRIWKSPRVKVGNAYKLDPGHIVIESIQQIELQDITPRLALETGFGNVASLIKTANHGSGSNVYLVTFRYMES